MVADRHDGALLNARFHELPELLDADDLLVVNVSATLPASVSGRRAGTWCGEPVRVQLLDAGAAEPGERWWVVEVRSADGAAPARGAPARRS